MDPLSRDKLAAYADGEFDVAERARIEAGLADDAAARAEVARWRALRQCAQRVLLNTAVPPGLADRVRAGLPVAHRRRTPRIYRLGFSGLAAAAVIMLAFFMWPQGARAKPIKASYFANQHRERAVVEHADTLGVRAGIDWEEFNARGLSGNINAIIREASFARPLAEVAAELDKFDYRLQGACAYDGDDDIQVTHAYYRCFQDISRGNTVSVFVLDRPVQLCGDDGCDCRCRKQGDREYRVAIVPIGTGKVTIVSWIVEGRTYVVCCGVATEDQLIHMADGLKLSAAASCPDAEAGCLARSLVE